MRANTPAGGDMAIRGSPLITFLFLVVVVMTVRGQSASAVTELDPSITASVEINGKTRLDLYVGREKSEEIESGKDKFGAGASFRIKPIFKRFLDAIDTDKKHLLVVGAIYEYSIAKEPASKSVEHKVMLDATLRYTIPYDLLLSNRNRSEFRWVNGDYHFRYRNRAMVERPVPVLGRDFTPYAAAEAVWDQRYRRWNIFKFSGVVVVPIARRASLDFVYERQHCVNCTDANTNIFGLALNIRLSRRKK